MRQDHGWTLSEMHDMIPYEFDIYVGQLNKWLIDKKEMLERKNQG